MHCATRFAAALGLLAATGAASAADWLLAPSTYTHDLQTGQRVSQYASTPPVVVPTRPDYLRSGYRHNRSSIYSGDGADNQHIVEQWGRPVRPYGEWLFPYRPYSVPYQFWGAPFAGLGSPAPQPFFRREGWGNHNPQPLPSAPALRQPWLEGEGDKPPAANGDWGAASGPT